MITVSHILIALFVLAIVAVLVSSKQTPVFIQSAGAFLVASIKKVESA